MFILLRIKCTIPVFALDSEMKGLCIPHRPISKRLALSSRGNTGTNVRIKKVIWQAATLETSVCSFSHWVWLQVLFPICFPVRTVVEVFPLHETMDQTLINNEKATATDFFFAFAWKFQYKRFLMLLSFTLLSGALSKIFYVACFSIR